MITQDQGQIILLSTNSCRSELCTWFHTMEKIIMIGMAAFALFAFCQIQLPQPKPATPLPPSTINSFVMPPPTTPSYYSSASGPSKMVGWPTSLYGPINPAPDLSSPIPYFLAYQPPMSPFAGCGGSSCSGANHCWFGKKKGCHADPNCPGCGNFRTDAIFIFGSCRAFFGEACWQGQSCPTPWDLLYGPNRPPQ